ncbi:MAG: type II secretion system F family protein [Candidatus Paracaedibacteraceae bacterium]|nr:type II secretion system F family protein [Candidatus Paracaedibacteraceae bacterium]
MPFYHFWALNENKTTTSGIIAGKSKNDVFITLKKFNQTPLKIKRYFFASTDRFSDMDRHEICLALSQLLKAGVTLTDALTTLSIDQATLSRRVICYTFAEFIRFGYGIQSFSETNFFDDTGFQTLLRAEKTSNLTLTFQTLSEYYKDKHEYTAEWKSIVRYPIFLMGMLCALIGILSCFVLPSLESFIPEASKGTAYTSFKWLSNNLEFIGISVAIFAAIGFFCKPLLYRIPVIRRIKMSPFWCNLSFCLNHNIPLIESIDLSARSLPTFLQPLIALVKNDIEAGATIFDSFQKLPAPSQTRASLILIAQKTGNVTEMIQHFANIERKYINNLIKIFISWTQPALILIMGLVVLWILQATIVPLYDSLAEFKD